jgi:hypothetical protein
VLVAVLLPVLIGLFLLAMHRFEARVFGPPDEDAGGLGPQGSVNADRAGATSGGAAPGGGQSHGDSHNGDAADMDRQGPGRRIEGRGPWTYR